jgi:glycine/D-amino acid oxidase-like deaminating enzyme
MRHGGERRARRPHLRDIGCSGDDGPAPARLDFGGWPRRATAGRRHESRCRLVITTQLAIVGAGPAGLAAAAEAARHGVAVVLLDDNPLPGGQYFRQGVPDIFAVGDGAGIGGAETAILEGRLGGFLAAERLGHCSGAEANAVGRRLRRRRWRLAQFRQGIEAMYGPPPNFLSLLTPETVVCRCEEVTAGQLLGGLERGASQHRGRQDLDACHHGPMPGAQLPRDCGCPRRARPPVPRGRSRVSARPPAGAPGTVGRPPGGGPAPGGAPGDHASLTVCVACGRVDAGRAPA